MVKVFFNEGGGGCMTVVLVECRLRVCGRHSFYFSCPSVLFLRRGGRREGAGGGVSCFGICFLSVVRAVVEIFCSYRACMQRKF